MSQESQVTVALAKARSQLMLSGPEGAFFGALAMSLVPVIRDDIETAATDGKHFYYNRAWFDSLSERERVGVVVHEVFHLFGMHHCRRNGRDLGRWNEACDYAINGPIIARRFVLPAGILIDDEYKGLSAEEIFRLREVTKQESEQPEKDLASPQQSEPSDDSGESAKNESDSDQNDSSDNQSQGGNESSNADNESDETSDNSNNEQGDESSQSGDAASSQSGDESSQSGDGDLSAEDMENMAYEMADKRTRRGADISDPGACGGIMDAAPASDPAAMAQAESDMAQRIRQAVAVARKANGGELPADLARLVGELTSPKLDARDMLRRFIDQSISKTYTWTRPNKRYLSHGLVLPSLVSDRPSHVVALVDVSGSLWSETAQAALTTELQGALDNGAADQITIVYADTDVTGSAEYFPGDQIAMEGTGGGGTDFRAPLQWVHDNCENVSAILYLTDMETCDYGDEPDAPLLWLVYGDPRYAKHYIEAAPFGEAVYIDE